jgi:hypothetical protein
MKRKPSNSAPPSPYSEIASALARCRAQVLSPERQHEISMMGVRARAEKRRERKRAAEK